MYSQIIEQIDWEMYRRNYWKIRDLELLKRKVREMRDSGIFPEFSTDEIKELKAMVVRGISKIQDYKYGKEIDSEKMRAESLEPLYKLLGQLNNMKEMETYIKGVNDAKY